MTGAPITVMDVIRMYDELMSSRPDKTIRDWLDENNLPKETIAILADSNTAYLMKVLLTEGPDVAAIEQFLTPFRLGWEMCRTFCPPKREPETQAKMTEFTIVRMREGEWLVLDPYTGEPYVAKDVVVFTNLSNPGADSVQPGDSVALDERDIETISNAKLMSWMRS